ncbi:MAG: hypothetical protein P8X42_07470 [Calditrichaceae bacterium]
MKISKPNIIEKENNLIYSVNVNDDSGSRELWYSIDHKYKNLVSDSLDTALTALLIPAMRAGEDIYLQGKISERLYFNSSKSIQTILAAIIPNLKIISIFPNDIQVGDQSAPGVATGFSGGIDSFNVLADHHYRKQPKGFQFTHLLYNNIGAHTRGGEKLFKERYDRLRETAEEKIGLPFIAVNSNLATFYHKISFGKTHTLRNASVAFLLKKGIGRFMYASTYQYHDIFIGSSKDLAYSDPVILPLLSTKTLDLISIGSESTRVEKTIKVAQIKDSYESLDVCIDVKGKNNCSTCWKCKRTLSTMEIAGVIKRYNKIFNRALYRKVRRDYYAEIILGKDYFLKEIKAFAKNEGFHFPFLTYVSVYTGIKHIRDFIKKIIKIPPRLKRSILRRLESSAVG